mmetsp:Transcript_14904/g.14485  ORF Transcript_14904/g.14485 Transcript_14904/m.14485 type:complete len:252 (+) Transcript_14904:256-1011(+)
MIRDFCLKYKEFYEPESKAAIIWIIGEYSEKIEKAEDILNECIDTFLEEPVKVQLQLLTSSVKLYLKKPDLGDPVIKRVLKIATEEGTNPDLMDRAYIYWRMLSSSPQKTKYVVLGEKPHIAEDSYNLYDEDFVDKLIEQMSTLSSVYHKTPEEMALALKKLQTNVATPVIKKDEEKKEEEKRSEEKKSDKKKGKEQPKKVEEEEEEENDDKKGKKGSKGGRKGKEDKEKPKEEEEDLPKDKKKTKKKPEK